MSDDDFEPTEETPRVPDRDRQSTGSEGRDHVQPSEDDDSAAGTAPFDQSDPLKGIDPDELSRNPLLLAQVTAHLQENHLHLPLLTPDIEVMEQMRNKTPELYKAYVQAVKSQTRADEISRTAPYTEPGKVAFRGQIAGLIAAIAVLVLAGFIVYMGHPITGGIIAAFDVVALAAVFAGGRPEPPERNDASGRGK